MKRTAGLRKVSAKQARENALRAVVKAQLIEKSKGRCQHCGIFKGKYGLDLVHLRHVGEGRRTDMQACEVWCRPCHDGPDGHKKVMPPGWAASKPALDATKGE